MRVFIALIACVFNGIGSFLSRNGILCMWLVHELELSCKECQDNDASHYFFESLECCHCRMSIKAPPFRAALFFKVKSSSS